MSVIGGVDWVVVQKAMQNWVVAVTQMPSTSVLWSQQDGARVPSPAIELRVSNVAEMGNLWVDEEDNPLTFDTLTVTGVDPAANTFAIAGHSKLTGDGPIHVESTGTLPTAVGGDIAPDTNYWIIAPDADHIQLARTYANTGGGQGAGNPTTPIDLTSAGSGTITVRATDDTVRAGQEINEVVRGYLRVTLELHAHSDTGVEKVDAAMATSILQRVGVQRMFSSQENILAAANISVTEVERDRAVMGVRDAALFEPRAYMDVHFCVPVEARAPMTVIAQAVLTYLTTGRTITVDRTP
jgi:hypothetical protein